MNYHQAALAGVSLLALGACAYMPQENLDRQIEISDMKAVVDCEVVAAARTLGPDILKIGKWDVKSGLELTLVEQVSADGRVTWVIPIANSLTPSASVSHKKTSIAHLDFVTIIREAMANPRTNCEPGIDPSGTALGLTSWIVSTFRGVTPNYYGGSSYTSIFELTAGAGGRSGVADTSMAPTATG